MKTSEVLQDEAASAERTPVIVTTRGGETFVNVAALREMLTERRERAVRGIDRFEDGDTPKSAMLANVYKGKRLAYDDALDWLAEHGA